MKMLLLLASLLSLATAHAQTPAAPSSKASPANATSAKTTAKRADAYEGPKVVDNTKALGHKMIQQSRPTDGLIRQDRLRPIKPRK